jgi:hypothetical protein
MAVWAAAVVLIDRWVVGRRRVRGGKDRCATVGAAGQVLLIEHCGTIMRA